MYTVRFVTINIIILSYDSIGPMAVNFNGIDYYYVLNAQGDVIAICSAGGTVVVSYEYDPWGKLLGTYGSLKDTLGQINPLTYRGYVYDRETGLYYLQSRYYSPELLRFICGDGLVSTGQDILGYNMFVYCLNSPINRYDIDGALSSQIMAEMVIGKRPNIYNYTMEDVIATAREEQMNYGTRVIKNPQSLKKSENDQVSVSLTYFPPELVDYIGTSGINNIVTIAGGVTSGLAWKKLQSILPLLTISSYLNQISTATTMYGIAESCVDIFYIDDVKQTAKNSNVGVVLVEEIWTVYDGQYWEFTKSYYVLLDGEYGTVGYAVNPF